MSVSTKEMLWVYSAVTCGLPYRNILFLAGHPALEIAQINDDKNLLDHVYKIICAYAQLGETEKALECNRKIEHRQVEEPAVVLDADFT
jgi:hypothetical protein